MKNDDFSRHSIADVRNWKKLEHLELQPDYQRRSLWNQHAKIMLIDSILENIPIPKIYIAASIKDGNTHRIVIDGQQRITAILEFLDNQYSLLKPYTGLYFGNKFKDLPLNIQSKILSYRLDFNEFENYSDDEIRKIYNRVNKYTVALNKQELRRADFPGDFLETSEELSTEDFFENSKIFTPTNIRRMQDVEFVSELLLILLNGIQDKKKNLDNYYIDFSKWDKDDLNSTKQRFKSILNDISLIFNEAKFPIYKSRFKQKSDFYSLFAAINDLHIRKCTINLENLGHLEKELAELNEWITPDREGMFGEYAIKCVSDANSKNSREWRKSFLLNYIEGTYNPDENKMKRILFFNNLHSDLDMFCSGGCHICPVCGKENKESNKSGVFCYPKNTIFPFCEEFLHKDCLLENQSDWVWLDE